MNVYFEQLTLAGIPPAFFWLIRGHKVWYFWPGRFLKKIPLLSALGLRWFHQTDYHLAEVEGLSVEVSDVALEAAEDLYRQVVQQNRRAVARWRKVFKTERVDLYIKKLLAMESIPPVTAFLLLRHLARDGPPPVRLVILDTPMNRLLLPILIRRYPEPALRVTGFGRPPWRYFVSASGTVLSGLEYLGRLALSVQGRGLCLRKHIQHCKVSKEILWGIGTGRRNDDFIVDGELIRPEDMLFYYRRSSQFRMAKPELLPISLANAAEKGYRCVDFERTSIPLPLIWRVMLPRYVVFPSFNLLESMVRQVVQPSAGLLSHIIMSFLGQTWGWEVFLASYAPRLNLSQDDPYLRHIADTVALNLHGSQNAGFQWSDDAAFRDALYAYAGFNVYFAWGSLAENYWKGNWGIEQVVHTGYLWGHHYEESLGNREELRRALTGDNQGYRFIVALFDEHLSDDFVREETLLNFYRVGTELLERRSDTVVVVKPKGYDGFRDIPAVMALLTPYVDSGRLIIRDRMTTDVQEVMAISDVVVSMIMGVPYLEAVCCGKPGFNYAPAKTYSSSPVYAQGHGKVVFDDVGGVVDAVDHVLDHPEDNPWGGLGELLDDVDPYRDFRGIDRMRRSIHEMSI
jgi:hypothetical protein